MAEKKIVNVGGTLFHLEASTIEALGSDFLNSLLDPSTPFCKPEDGSPFCVSEADPEIFAGFVHLAKSGIPTKTLLERGEAVQQEADFWGVKEHVDKAIILANDSTNAIKRAWLRQRLARGSIVGYDGWHPNVSPVKHCCVCGVRWTYQSAGCELSSCPFNFYSLDRNDNQKLKYSADWQWLKLQHPFKFSESRWWVCEPCGDTNRPDLAMGSFWCEHDYETLKACFKCKGTCNGACRRYW